MGDRSFVQSTGVVVAAESFSQQMVDGEMCGNEEEKIFNQTEDSQEMGLYEKHSREMIESLTSVNLCNYHHQLI